MKRISIGCRLFLLAFAVCCATVAPSLYGAELQLLLQVHMEDAPHDAPELVMARTLFVLRNRLHHLNLDGASVTPQPGQRIAVHLPSVTDPERIERLLQERALLEFRIVDFPTGTDGEPSRDQILKHYNGHLPAELEILEQNLPAGANLPAQTLYYAAARKAVVSGDVFESARVVKSNLNSPALGFHLKAEPAEMFKKTTGESVHKHLAIMLDGRVLATPVIRSSIDGRGVIEENFTQREAEDLASILGSGALPVRVTVVESAGGKKPS